MLIINKHWKYLEPILKKHYYNFYSYLWNNLVKCNNCGRIMIGTGCRIYNKSMYGYVHNKNIFDRYCKLTCWISFFTPRRVFWICTKTVNRKNIENIENKIKNNIICRTIHEGIQNGCILDQNTWGFVHFTLNPPPVSTRFIKG